MSTQYIAEMVGIDPEPGPPREIMLTVVGYALLLATALVGWVLFGDVKTPVPHAERNDIQGTVSVPFGGSSKPVSCHLPFERALKVLGGEATAPCPAGPLGAFGDVADGAEVTVTDPTGTVLGEGELTRGVADGGTVTFRFTVEDVPRVGGYRVEVNNRGAVPFTAARLESRNWQLALNLR